MEQFLLVEIDQVLRHRVQEVACVTGHLREGYHQRRVRAVIARAQRRLERRAGALFAFAQLVEEAFHGVGQRFEHAAGPGAFDGFGDAVYLALDHGAAPRSGRIPMMVVEPLAQLGLARHDFVEQALELRAEHALHRVFGEPADRSPLRRLAEIGGAEPIVEIVGEAQQRLDQLGQAPLVLMRAADAAHLFEKRGQRLGARVDIGSGEQGQHEAPVGEQDPAPVAFHRAGIVVEGDIRGEPGDVGEQFG